MTADIENIDASYSAIKAMTRTLDLPLANRASPIQLSFQLMTCAEPPEMVIASIKSLLAIKDAADEIVIIDNNNTNIEHYQPLATFCHGLDSALNVHFYHVDAVAGFKAGALNLALELMNSSCSHVVVVDSDYQALAQARMVIAAAIQCYPTHALLQFPQFYRDGGRDDVHRELNHYFNHHLYRSFNRQRALSTGTYAVIRRDALLTLGGWSGASITEDAQMGVLMHKHGMRSQFIPEVIATGLLPNTINDLMSQRRRWIYGNVQVLKSYFSISSLSSVSQITERFAYRRAHFSQLSAWINFTGLFMIGHIFVLLIIVSALLLGTTINLDTTINSSSLLTALYAIYISYALFLGRRLWAYLQDNAPLNSQVDIAQVNNKQMPKVNSKIRAWLLHLNFWELGALSWVPVLWGRDKPFICTPKQTLISTQKNVWTSNLIALPKLLLTLNIITALMVAPFSPLYSPILFIFALSICLLKLWAAKIIFTNYAYVESSSKSAIQLSTELNEIYKETSIIELSSIKLKAANSEPRAIFDIQQSVLRQSALKQSTIKRPLSKSTSTAAELTNRKIVSS